MTVSVIRLIYSQWSVNEIWSICRIILMGELKYWKKNLSQCYFIHHKSNVYWRGIEPECLWWETSDWLPEPWHSQLTVVLLIVKVLIFFTMVQQLLWARASSLLRIHDHTQLDTPDSLGFLWSSDQPDTETFTWQHAPYTTDRRLCFQQDSNP
jgi:hypothetical protein